MLGDQSGVQRLGGGLGGGGDVDQSYPGDVLVFLLLNSLALPLIENPTFFIVMTMILIVIEVVHIVVVVIGDNSDLVTETGELLLHLVTSDTVSVKDLVEVGDDQTLHMEIGSTATILNTLNSC